MLFSTSPDPSKVIVKGKGPNSRTVRFISEVIGRCTTQDPTVYLFSKRTNIILEHLKAELSRREAEHSKILAEDDYVRYRELETIKPILLSELQRLRTEKKGSSRIIAMISELIISSETNTLVKSVVSMAEEKEQLERLLETQNKALVSRRLRSLYKDITPALAQCYERETEELKRKTINGFNGHPDIIFELEEMKAEFRRVLMQRFRSNDHDKTVKMADIMEYVKKNSPVIQFMNSGNVKEGALH